MSLKKTIKNVALISATTYASYKLLANTIFDSVFKKNDENYELSTQYIQWLKQSKTEDVFINSYDGLQLNALKIENHPTNNYIFIVHGIWSNYNWMVPFAYEFDKLGYNILLINQRASGKSEGEYYTYGLKESFDLINWTNYLTNLKNNVSIIYYGVSMGAATCMMTTKNKLPSNVKCIIEDCGYSSFKDELSSALINKYKIIKPSPILKLVEVNMIDKFGFTFDDISPAKALNENEIPLFIIHGEEDRFVPFEMSKVIYNNQKGYKKYYPVKGAKHAKSYLNKNYFKHCDEFLKKFI